MGVYEAGKCERVAEALRLLGSENVMVVHADDGLDEFTIAGTTKVWHLKDGVIKHDSVTPEDAGLKRGKLSDIEGGGAKENAEIITNILKKKKAGTARDIVILNAAAALVVAGKASDFKDSAALAAASIDDGKAWELLERLKDVS